MQIRLTDNGIGIEKEDLKHIFERLYKCDKGRAEKGSGLGLSIVHQLVEKMNGTITADSVPEKGTKFTFTFSVDRLRLFRLYGGSLNYFRKLYLKLQG